MLNANFSTQRDSSGNALYNTQTVTQTPLAASVVGGGQVSATLKSTAVTFATALKSVSAVSAPLSAKNVFISSHVASSSNATVATWNNTLLGTQIKAAGKITGQLANNATFACSINSTSTLAATLPTNSPLAVFIVGNSSVKAMIQTGPASNIPVTARLRATPYNSFEEQIVRFRGDTYADSFMVVDCQTGEPVDVAGSTFLLTVSSDKTGSDVVEQVQGVVDGNEVGLVYFTPDEGTADHVGFYYYDVQMRDPANVIRTLISSSYVYQQDITKN